MAIIRQAVLCLLAAILWPVVVLSYNRDLPFGTRLRIPSQKAPQATNNMRRALLLAPSSDIDLEEIFGSAPVLHLVSKQHPELVESQRQPMMVETTSLSQLVLPPLTSALPMNHFHSFQGLSSFDPKKEDYSTTPSTEGSVTPLAQLADNHVFLQFDKQDESQSGEGELTSGTSNHLSSQSSHLQSFPSLFLSQQKISTPRELKYEVVSPFTIDRPSYKPKTRSSFTCANRKMGFYADVESHCQKYHRCTAGGQYSFSCVKGTVFNQKSLTCDWPNHVDCTSSVAYYHLNEDRFPENKAKPYGERSVSKRRIVERPRSASNWQWAYEPQRLLKYDYEVSANSEGSHLHSSA